MTMSSNNDIVLSLSNLLKTNKGFFKSEKQAAFILSQTCENEIINHFTTYKNIARDHYHLDVEGIYKIERYTKKKGYITTWERGQVHSLEAAKNRINEMKSQFEKNQLDAFGYTIEPNDFYAFNELFDSYNKPRLILDAVAFMTSEETEDFLKQVMQFKSLVNDFKSKYHACHP